MKLESERKKLILDAVKMAVVIGIAGGIYFATSMWAGSVDKEKQTISGQASQQQSEIGAMHSKIDNSGTSKKLYTSVVEERGNEDFEIDTDKVRDVLQELVKQHRISLSDKLEYSAEHELKHPELTALTTPVFVRQDAKLRFSAISDLHVYAFIDGLARKLPGVIRITQFKLTRKAPLDTDTIAQLAEGKQVNTVDAELTFDWFGFKPVPEKQEPAAAENNAPAAPPAMGATP